MNPSGQHPHQLAPAQICSARRFRVLRLPLRLVREIIVAAFVWATQSVIVAVLWVECI
eukprot:m.177582 g.177582  ORF g.177582 m.177582 type:complete len:58 (-) comp53372_c0_seq4:1386-1559(-)